MKEKILISAIEEIFRLSHGFDYSKPTIEMFDAIKAIGQISFEVKQFLNLIETLGL